MHFLITFLTKKISLSDGGREVPRSKLHTKCGVHIQMLCKMNESLRKHFSFHVTKAKITPNDDDHMMAESDLK